MLSQSINKHKSNIYSQSLDPYDSPSKSNFKNSVKPQPI